MPTGLRFVFSSINWRTKETHPIETVLLKDILLLLGKSEAEIKTLFQNIVKDEELERKHKAEEQKRKEAERIRIEEERKKEEARKLKEELRYVKKQEENSTQSYNVTLENAGANKLAVVKVVKECMGIGLVEAKFIVDNTPIIITEKALKNEAV
ncbi:MAG: ribosomal protein L7/L12, partial [Bacteroidales bacterium]|nr:ribosomal protein L7/L12 [Bacteroidales bacterium]